jgi:hypothetical protein
MAKFIGKGLLQQFSQEVSLSALTSVQDLPGLLKMPEDYANILIVVRNHQKLEADELINNEDEIFIFLAVMGG